MNQISFFTPVQYNWEQKTFKHKIIEFIDDYFDFNGRKACVLPLDNDGSIQFVEYNEKSENNSSKIISIAIKIATYITGIIPLLMLIAKAIIRAKYRYFTDDPFLLKLQQGITLSDHTSKKLESVMERVLKREADSEVKLYSGEWNHRIFSLNSNPNVIFKLAPGKNEETEKRFQNMALARRVCWKNKLDLLVVPSARKFEIEHDGQKYTVIMEEKLDLNSNLEAQKQQYKKCGNNLDEALKQLTVFICKTGFSDVKWQNALVLNSSTGEQGNRKIALIDLEELNNSETGIFGSNDPYRRGLIGCVSQRQFDIIIEEAAKHNVVNETKALDAKRIRLTELNGVDERVEEIIHKMIQVFDRLDRNDLF